MLNHIESEPACRAGCPDPCTADPVYPGRPLRRGSCGSETARMQTYLSALGFPARGALAADGKFGPATERAVCMFQKEYSLKADGIIGPATWDAVVCSYNARFEGSRNTWPGIALRPGMRGQDVHLMQEYLNALSRIYSGIGMQTADGIYGSRMTGAVRRFQYQFGLSADGILGKLSWARILAVKEAAESGAPLPVTTRYPGSALRRGSQGDHVRFVQSYLNGALGLSLSVDGIFGSATENACRMFQQDAGLTADGIAGRATWTALIPAFNRSL